MALVSGVIGSFVLLEIRTDIVTITGLQNAGIYEGLQRISSYYLLFVSSIMTIYFYPKIAAKNSNLNVIIFNYLKTIIPIFTFVLVLIYIFRNFSTLKINELLKAIYLFYYSNLDIINRLI